MSRILMILKRGDVDEIWSKHMSYLGSCRTVESIMLR
jgi:hypothetical protein